MSILSRIAAVHNPSTKTEAVKLLRAARADGLSLPAGRQSELAATLAAEAQAQRAKRNARQIARIVTLEPSLAERFAAHRRAVESKLIALVRDTRRDLYRVAADAGKYAPRSGHTTTIRVGDVPSVRSSSEKVWGQKYPATSSTHTYTVRRDWSERVYDHDLEVVDGMFTLDAEPIQGVGPELYKATWVEQGRGTSLNQVTGYIARHDGHTYHASSARAALDGVQRKAGLKPARRQGVVDLDKLARRYGDLPVRFSDATECGACVSGTRSWCFAVGIDPDGIASLADVVSGYKLRPMPEAMRVLRRVVRDRHNRQPLDLESGAAELLAEGTVVFDAEGGFRIVPPTDGGAAAN